MPFSPRNNLGEHDRILKFWRNGEAPEWWNKNQSKLEVLEQLLALHTAGGSASDAVLRHTERTLEVIWEVPRASLKGAPNFYPPKRSREMMQRPIPNLIPKVQER